ncbi:MAG: tRNA (N6-threonylcarbamoyladenosine(37)-N6)-methyltransferase TrmO [Bacteroidaceae bacterium]|nr:tRNA (N6-threonylcarbamoyladenosine(37)-N6)-methyltransferase TrmO [Bacteroidaceae bacterium]
MQPIAHFHSPFATKFGIPRQSGLVPQITGRIVFVPEWRTPEALRGLEGYDYLWLLWEFSAHRHAAKHPTVRPPLLGGNRRMGVFATRSPFRPNNIGLSSVRLNGIDYDTPLGPIIHVGGADLMDGTPILDIKPYLPHVDSHPQARGGFADGQPWPQLRVSLPPEVAALFTEQQRAALTHALELDPRPHYHADAAKVYALTFAGRDIRFRVTDGILTVLSPGE